jgi:prepilin-type N-terminal cleavage/methylation domain-containing protein
MRRRLQSGLTLLEIMIVIAIIGLLLGVLAPAVRTFTHGDLTDDTAELVGYLRRASQLAIENGEQMRVLIDVDTGTYVVEECKGAASLAKNQEVIRPDADKLKAAQDKGQERLRDLPQDALAVGDADEAMKRAIAIAGHHIADRTCAPVREGLTGQSTAGGAMSKKENAEAQSKSDWIRHLHSTNGIKFKEIHVQHKDETTTKGQVAIYFYPNGSAEKAVIVLVEDDKTYRTILVYGLTGWIQQKTGRLDDIDDHMMRNAMGDRDKRRETE